MRAFERAAFTGKRPGSRRIATKWHTTRMSPRFLTLADVAETLNLTMSAARSLVSTGELPAIQVGGKKAWRIEESVLEQYIEDQYAATRERIAEHSSF